MRHSASVSFNYDMHHDVIKWKRFPNKMALWEGNSPIVGAFPHKILIMRSFEFFLFLTWSRCRTKQSSCRWFESSWVVRFVWCHCSGLYVCVYIHTHALTYIYTNTCILLNCYGPYNGADHGPYNGWCPQDYVPKIICWNSKLKEYSPMKRHVRFYHFVFGWMHIKYMYFQTSNISHALEGNEIVDHSDVVGASPVGAAPTTPSFST